eukprot:924042-Prymnesium_polylepis.2
MNPAPHSGEPRRVGQVGAANHVLSRAGSVTISSNGLARPGRRRCRHRSVQCGSIAPNRVQIAQTAQACPPH